MEGHQKGASGEPDSWHEYWALNRAQLTGSADLFVLVANTSSIVLVGLENAFDWRKVVDANQHGPSGSRLMPLTTTNAWPWCHILQAWRR